MYSILFCMFHSLVIHRGRGLHIILFLLPIILFPNSNFFLSLFFRCLPIILIIIPNKNMIYKHDVTVSSTLCPSNGLWYVLRIYCLAGRLLSARVGINPPFPVSVGERRRLMRAVVSDSVTLEIDALTA